MVHPFPSGISQYSRVVISDKIAGWTPFFLSKVQ